VFDEPNRRLADHDATCWCDRFHPLRHPDVRSERRVTLGTGADLAEHHIAGVQSDTQRNLHTVSSLHLIREPLPLLFNEGAVILGLVYGYLPFMVLPLYATLEKLDPALFDAAQDLGATPWVTFWRVIVPLSRSGIVSGVFLVFIPCLGAYLTPDLLGGGRSLMVGNLVQNQFTTARDWPFGSAVSLLLMLLVLLLLLRVIRRQGEELL